MTTLAHRESHDNIEGLTQINRDIFASSQAKKMALSGDLVQIRALNVASNFMLKDKKFGGWRFGGERQTANDIWIIFNKQKHPQTPMIITQNN